MAAGGKVNLRLVGRPLVDRPLPEVSPLGTQY
jgi:hypothetical protein